MRARLRLTTFVRQTQGLDTRLLADTREKELRVRDAAGRDGDRVFARAQAYVPRRTHFLANSMVYERTRGGYNWLIGHQVRDFVGKLNPATGKVVTFPYFLPVIHGSRGRAGNNYLHRAFVDEAENRARGFRRALGGTG